MASYTISPIWGAGAQLFDNSGNVLTGGKIYVYEAGTTTPAVTYTDSIGSAQNSNPIVANASGRLPNEIWFKQGLAFKFVLKDANDVLLATYDNIPSSPQPAITNDASSISYEQGYEVTAGNFTVGATYLITSVGTTNFMSIGAAANVTGIRFTATGVGSGTGTAQYSRFLQDKLRETVSVKDFGAVGDGVADDTAAIQAAIDTGALAITPKGTYKVTASLVIGTSQHLHLMNGATITKSTGTIEPVVRIVSNNAFLTGDGYNSIIRTTDVTGFPSDPSKEGVVNIGAATLNQSANINWAKVSNIAIRGSDARWTNYNTSAGVDTAIDLDIGIKMVNGAAFNTVGSDSLYNTTIDNIYFSYLGIGIDCEPVVQGNNFHMLYFFRCTLYGVQMKGCRENSLNQTFFHNSPGITYVRLCKSLSTAEATALGFTEYPFPDRTCEENSFTNLLGEPGTDGPGGRDSRVFNFDAYTFRNYLQGNQNTGHSNADTSTDTSGNFYILDGVQRKGDVTFNNVTGWDFIGRTASLIPTSDTDIVLRQNIQKTYSVAKSGVNTGQKIRFTFSGADRRSFGFMVKAKAVRTAANAITDHGFVIAGVNIVTLQDGATIASNIAAMYENNFTAATYITATAVGSGHDFYLDIENPTGDNGTAMSVHIEALDTLSALNLLSVTVI